MNPFLSQLETLGFTLVRAKTSRNWPVLERAGKKIMLPPHPLQSGDWVFVDLTDKSTHRIERLLGLPFGPKAVLNYTPPDVDWASMEWAAKNKWAFLKDHSFNLLKERGIDPALVSPMLGGLKGGYSRLFAPLYLDVEGRARLVGISIRYSVNAIFLAGKKRIFGKRGVAFLGQKNADLYVFESEIDALSHYQVMKKKDLFFSPFYAITFGHLSKMQLDTIAFSFKKNKNRKVYSCFDNDDAGEVMSVKLAASLTECERVLPPEGKDWNEFLFLEKNKK